VNQLSLKQIFKIFWDKVLVNYKFKLSISIVIIIFAAFAELLTLSAILPFLSVLSDPEMIFNDVRFSGAINFLDATSGKDLILPFTIIFCVLAGLGTIFRLAANYASMRVAFSIGHQVATKIYRNVLERSYSNHISANNNEVIATLSAKLERVVFSIVLQFFLLLAALIISIIILSMLIYINPLLTLIVALLCGLFYYLVILLINKLLLSESKIIAQASTKQIKTIRESLGGIRDVFINNAHDFYYAIFQMTDYKLRRGQAINMFASMSPRFLIEAIGLIIIVITAYYLSKQTSFNDVIPMLGLLAISAQKLLPLFQQFYVAWTAIKGNYESLQDVTILLDESSEASSHPSRYEPITFHDFIELRDITFAHDGDNPVLFQNLDLQIKRGDRIGIIGKTGSGKSTFVDIVAGLLFPVSGGVYIDGIKLNQGNAHLWMKSVAYVPQNIFLSDESILDNIVIGELQDNIDLDLASSALKCACLEEFISSLPNGIHTKVGERGVKISGGQRQRIGIARAIYKKAKFIIFDEATSALDSSTEDEVMNSIYQMDSKITMLVIAHRTSTLKNCSKIIRIENSRIETFSPSEL
jgi:ATP-binding cassette, subfamily B, bacterial PglK